jgi:NADH-quinone oxidoreductase subunit C
VPRGRRQLGGHAVAEPLTSALPGIVTAVAEDWIEVAPARLVEALRWLRDSPQLDAKQLANVSAVDRHDHFEVVYFLQSLDRNHLIEVKALVRDHEAPSLPSAYPVYKGALLQEREIYDLMGIHFEGHPDLRRLFLWEGYPGFPLRKDFLQIPEHHPGLPKFPFEQSGVQAR